MNIEELKKEYPKLTAKVEDFDSLQSLIVVDENYDDEDADDSVDFDADEFNYMVYITERSQKALGVESLKNISVKLSDSESFDDFLASEDDLFGVQSNLNEISIAKVVLKVMEKELS